MSPFTYEHPVAPEDVINREAEVSRLGELVRAGRFVRLVAPRRYGKTSVLRKVLAGVADDERPRVLVDFYGVVSVADVAHRIERAYAAQLQGRLRAAAERFLNASGLGISLGALGISASLQRVINPDPSAALQRLLDLPLDVLARTGSVPVVVFDEFQDILRADPVDAVIRSRIQHHGAKVGYVFCGSEPGMMRELFGARSRPLYGQAIAERLGRLADGDVAEYIHDRFERTGKNAGDTVALLLSVALGHPQRTMLLAHHLWQHTPPGATADIERWEAALDATEAELRDEFRAHWRGLDTAEQRALRALGASQGRPFAQAPLASVDLKKSTAAHAYDRLIDRGDLERDQGDALRFVDPLLKRWILRTAAAP